MNSLLPGRRLTAACFLLAVTCGCTNETRPVGVALPMTPPSGIEDPRISQYDGNAYQVSQGGRYFLWYGCAGCHAIGSSSGTDLATGVSRHGNGFDEVYASVAHGHSAATGGYEQRIPSEQIWQLASYVRSLPALDPQKRRRQDIDMYAEPHDRHGPQGR